jgi:hypothetical protein
MRKDNRFDLKNKKRRKAFTLLLFLLNHAKTIKPKVHNHEWLLHDSNLEVLFEFAILRITFFKKIVCLHEDMYLPLFL